MKYFKLYLMITSIIIHLVVVIGLFWIVPFVIRTMDTGKKWEESENTNKRGIIQDISELEDGELKYKGYAVQYDNREIYVMGVGTDDFKVGDQVKVIINPHPYGPLKTLMVSIEKL